MKYSKANFLKDTDTILNLYGKTIFEKAGPKTKTLPMLSPELTIETFNSIVSIQHRRPFQEKSGLLTGSNFTAAPLKCFDDRRSDRLWLMILKIFMNKNVEVCTSRPINTDRADAITCALRIWGVRHRYLCAAHWPVLWRSHTPITNVKQPKEMAVLDNTYDVVVATPMGELPGKAVLNIDGNSLSGMLSHLNHNNPFSGGSIEAGKTAFKGELKTPVGRMPYTVTGTLTEGRIETIAKTKMGELLIWSK